MVQKPEKPCIHNINASIMCLPCLFPSPLMLFCKRFAELLSLPLCSKQEMEHLEDPCAESLIHV